MKTSLVLIFFVGLQLATELLAQENLEVEPFKGKFLALSKQKFPNQGDLCAGAETFTGVCFNEVKDLVVDVARAKNPSWDIKIGVDFRNPIVGCHMEGVEEVCRVIAKDDKNVANYYYVILRKLGNNPVNVTYFYH